jgi:hypothetical protein
MENRKLFGRGSPLSGYAEDSFINITANADAFTRHIGADGEVSRSKSADNTHNVTLTLKQSSLSNQHLSTIHQTDKLAGKSMLPLVITDLNGATLYSWPQAWIQKTPDWGYGKDNADRAWIFQTGQAVATNQGGTIL